MFTLWNKDKRAIWENIGSVILGALLLLACSITWAEPYLAVQSNNQCMACHVNPTGGGARNSFGNYFGSHVLPEQAGDLAVFDPGALSETIRLGANLRTNFTAQATAEQENSKGFETQSAQLYVHLKPKGAPFSLYIDEQVAPGAAINREAFVLLSLADQDYLKVGRFFMPYGLRLEDDTAFVRQVTQFNFDNSDNGIEAGVNFGPVLLNAAISNGTSATANDDNRLQYLTRVEYFGGTWRVGANVVLNRAEAGKRVTSGVYAGVNLGGYVLLAEWDQVTDESIQNGLGDNMRQRVGLVELNRLVSKGVNLKLTYEALDPDTGIDNDLRTRTSGLIEYTPYANLQLRGGLRVGEDIPQRNDGNVEQLYMQLHVYY